MDVPAGVAGVDGLSAGRRATVGPAAVRAGHSSPPDRPPPAAVAWTQPTRARARPGLAQPPPGAHFSQFGAIRQGGRTRGRRGFHLS